jgi:hypothetical protein
MNRIQEALTNPRKIARFEEALPAQSFPKRSLVRNPKRNPNESVELNGIEPSAS